MSELPGAAPATDHDEGSPRVVISGLNRTAFDLAVYASQGWSPTHHARLASGCWSGSTGRDWLPAGFHLKGFKLPTILLVCLFPASLAYWRQRREECCNPPEALTSWERLLPPARAQGFGTSCGLDRLSQGSPCPRSSGGDSRLPRRRMSPGSLPVFSLRRSPVSTIASLDRIGVGIDTARYGHRVSFLRPDRKPAAKPLTVMENRAGYQALQDRLNQLHEQHPTAHFHVRIDAAGQYAVNLELFLRSLKPPPSSALPRLPLPCPRAAPPRPAAPAAPPPSAAPRRASESPRRPWPARAGPRCRSPRPDSAALCPPGVPPARAAPPRASAALSPRRQGSRHAGPAADDEGEKKKKKGGGEASNCP